MLVFYSESTVIAVALQGEPNARPSNMTNDRGPHRQPLHCMCKSANDHQVVDTESNLQMISI